MRCLLLLLKLVGVKCEKYISALSRVAEAAGLKHVALPEFENADGRLQH